MKWKTNLPTVLQIYQFYILLTPSIIVISSNGKHGKNGKPGRAGRNGLDGVAQNYSNKFSNKLSTALKGVEGQHGGKGEPGQRGEDGFGHFLSY